MSNFTDGLAMRGQQYRETNLRAELMSAA